MVAHAQLAGGADDATPALPDPYEIVSIRAVPAPSGATGTSWHRYEISQGHNKIIGFRDGGMAKVTLAVETIVLRLNERRKHARGRVHVILKPRKGAQKVDGDR